MITEFKRKFSIPRPSQLGVIENGNNAFKTKFVQNRLNTRRDSLTSKASKEIQTSENGKRPKSHFAETRKKITSNNNLNTNFNITNNNSNINNSNINNNNNNNYNDNNTNIKQIDCEILKDKINLKFYKKLASLLNSTLSVTHDCIKNNIKFTFKSKKFFKKSDINELDITLNSEKLKDLSPKTPQGVDYNQSNQNINYPSYKLQSDNKLSLNLNSLHCYNINEEEELYEEEKENEEILNEIKMKYKICVDESNVNNNNFPGLNGIDTYIDENNNKKILFKFDDESEIKGNLSNSIDPMEMNEFNDDNVDEQRKELDKEHKNSLIPHVSKTIERQLDFKKLMFSNKKFTEISSQSQLNHIINLIEAKSAGKN